MFFAKAKIQKINSLFAWLLFTSLCVVFFPVFPQAVAVDTLDKTEFISIPAGEFIINNSYFYKFQTGVRCPIADDNCRLKIKISAFSIAKQPINRKQWENFFGKIKFSPWEKKDLPECPQCYASSFKYDEVVDFIKELSKKETGKNDSYRLPTESEIIYLLSSCASDCGEIMAVSSQMYFKLNKPYRNKFGFSSDLAKEKIFFWTSDNASNYYLGDILSSSNPQKPPYVNPSPAVSDQFSYGKTLLSYSIESNDSQFTITRLGHSKNMIPDDKEIVILLVKKEK